MHVPSRALSASTIAVGLLLAGMTPALSANPSAAPSTPMPAPVCANGAPPSWVTGATHPNDGVPDPAGRIVFGLFLRNDEFLGQLVSLYAIDPDGSDLVQLLDCETARPRFSPDVKRLAFTIATDDGHVQIATMGVDGSDMRVLTSTAGYAETPDWSPDGTWLMYAQTACPDHACLKSPEFRESLWRMDADGANQRLIGDPDVVDWEPRISPDGGEVVFTRVDPPNHDWHTLMIRDLATGEERVVTDNVREPEHPEWTPDGKSIIYNTLHLPGQTSLFEQIETVPADDPTAEPVVLYPSGGGQLGYKPTYSPDGTTILFVCEGMLCRMDADGSNVTKVFGVPGTELNHVAWGSCPRPTTDPI